MYIWNRSERVNNPEDITICFNRWVNKQKQLKKLMSNQKDQVKIQKRIDTQTRNYEEAMHYINKRNQVKLPIRAKI